MIDFTPERIREACGAALLVGGPSRVSPRDAPARAVVDSRAISRGDLFFGIRGENVDGGEFAEQAVQAGAWGVIARPEHALRLAGIAQGALRVMAVEDPLQALGNLARAWVDRLWAEGCKVIGITGSTGKTSTKDILLALLSRSLSGPVHASPKNYNTEVGLPLAVLSAEAETKALVLEMAMRGPGQIRELCAIAPPEIGVITNVGPVHLELLGTVEAVAEAKAELIAALPPEGTCVVPATAEALRPHLRREVRTLTFANWSASGSLPEVERVAGAAADVRVLWAKPTKLGEQNATRAEIAIGPERTVFDFNFRQAHNLVNALAAMGAAHALGVPTRKLAEGAREVVFSELRGEETELPGGGRVINDCYNANPMSMRAALDHLAEVGADNSGARTVAVLGEMAELGPGAPAFHRQIGEYAARRGVAVLVAVGPLARHYLEGFGAGGEGAHVEHAEEAAERLRESLTPADVVLVKGSRSVGLERVTEHLLEPEGSTTAPREDRSGDG